jgi:hypothetical protein
MRCRWPVVSLLGVALVLSAACKEKDDQEEGDVRNGESSVLDSQADIGGPETAGDLADGKGEETPVPPPDVKPEIGEEIEIQEDTQAPPPDSVPDSEPETEPGEVQPDVAPGCQTLPALGPFYLDMTFPFEDIEIGAELKGEAWVTSVGPNPTDSLGDVEVVFTMKESGETAALYVTLPDLYLPPLEVGESVTLVLAKQAPWWTNTYVAIWDSGLHLRMFAYDGDGSFQPANCPVGPCPKAKLLPTDCKPVEGNCGTVVHPPIEFSGGWGYAKFVLEQGEIHEEQVAEGTYKFFGLRSENVVEMDCDDYPGTWVSALFLDNFSLSQCYCKDGFDCAVDEVCETEVHRCVPNLCLAINCLPGDFCDPYFGVCFPPPPTPLTSCETTADCPQDEACGMVCNTYLGFCEEANCCLADCMGWCSDLMQGCFECLSDCDCTAGGGFCSPETNQCVACNEAKIGFPKKNPEAYEFYELCIPKDLPDPEGAKASLLAIDDTIYCGMTGFFAGCDKDKEEGCHGSLEYAAAGSKVISDDKWEQLCSLSLLSFVSKMGGGHWVD